MFRSIRLLDKLLDHFSIAQIETLLSDEALLHVLMVFEPRPERRLREEVREAQKGSKTHGAPGALILEYVEQFGAAAVWNAVPQELWTEGAEEAPAPTPLEPVPELSRAQLMSLVALTVASSAGALPFLLGASETWKLAGSVASIGGGLGVGTIAFGTGGAIGGLVMGIGTVLSAMGLAAAGYGFGRWPLTVAVLAGMGAGAFAGVPIYQRLAKRNRPRSF